MDVIWFDTTIERAWAAGFFDGEGSTGVWFTGGSTKRDPGRRYCYLRVQLGQAENPVALHRFHRAVEHEGSVFGPYAPHTSSKKDYWQYVASGGKGHNVLDLLWPYLSEPKRHQAEEAIEKEKAHKDSLTPLKMGPIMPEEATVA